MLPRLFIALPLDTNLKKKYSLLPPKKREMLKLMSPGIQLINHNDEEFLASPLSSPASQEEIENLKKYFKSTLRILTQDVLLSEPHVLSLL
jgi:hypothetical protein